VRLAVLADIHDNLPALKAVLADARAQRVDGIIGAGDYLVRGPFPRETLDLVRSVDAWLIRGNTDGYVLDYAAGQAPEPWYTSSRWAALRWAWAQLSPERLDFLRGLREELVLRVGDADPIYVCHGAPNNPLGRLIPDQDKDALRSFRRAGFLAADAAPPDLRHALSGVDQKVVICAHAHIPWSQNDGDLLVLNPGAVSGALNGDPRAYYALLSWRSGRWQVQHRAVHYDMSALRQAYGDTGYLEEGGAIARAFLLTVETGQNILGPLFSHASRMTRAAGYHDLSAVPDSLWHWALRDFAWPDGRA